MTEKLYSGNSRPEKARLKKYDPEEVCQEEAWRKLEAPMQEIFGEVKSREEVMKEIESDAEVYAMFLDLNQDFKERFIGFCMGVRCVQMTYDPFFKYIFDAEVHPERLSAFLSQIIGQTLQVKRMLPTEHRRISEKGSLLILDILVEFENGELADVEIQKIGYLFPGQRASCYASDMVMRQYERERNLRGDNFTYKDLKKVYTIVLVEKSGKELKEFSDCYIHRGKWIFDSGLKLEMLQEFFFIPLDIFLSIEDNKEEGTAISELEAWLLFIGSDRPKHISRVIEKYSGFAELYREIVHFRHHPKEAIGMFSEALRILDQNTVNYMIDEMKQEIEEQRKKLEEKDKRLTEEQRNNQEQQKKLEAQERELKELRKLLAEKEKK